MSKLMQMAAAGRFVNGRTSPVSQFDRRAFLKTVAIGGVGFAVGCRAQAPTEAGSSREIVLPKNDPNASLTDLNAFVKVGSDDTITVVVKHLEMGQGSSTGLTTIVAEEMDADWSQLRWEHAPANIELYVNTDMGIQGSGGSTGIHNSYAQLRQMGAGAKNMLLQAAAEAWDVDIGELSVSNGTISHPSGKSGRYGEFAEAAASKTPAEDLTLKSPEDFVYIGKKTMRLDSPTKVMGVEPFTIDQDAEGMIHAAIVHSPKFGGTVKSFDAAEAKAVPGVIDVVKIATGVAVAAESYYVAKKAADLLTVEWDFSKAETRSSSQLFEEFRKTAEKPGTVATNEGDAEAALASAAKVVEASYEFPYLAHATMEPMNAVVQIADGTVNLWSGCQSTTGDQMVLSAITGIPPQNVHIHTLVAGGSFGRRATLVSDYVADAAMIAMALGTSKHLKLQWTRENDMAAGRYRPMAHIQVKGGVDEDGNITAWKQRNVVPSYAVGTPWEHLFIKDGIDGSIVEGIRDNAYGIANMHFDIHMPQVGVPASWWRSVGHTFNAYVKETFFHQLAVAGGRDPLELRRDMLADKPRELAVLNKAVKEAGPAPKGKGKGRGIAVHESFLTHVAEVADVTLNADGSYTVDKVTCAIDCGVAVNPDIVKAQVEGSIIMGLGAAKREEITLTNGEIDQQNFYNYFPARMSDAPKEVNVHIIPSAEAPSGAGEPGLPPIAPAVANALQDAGAKPIQKHPFGDTVDV